jgi:predicted MFS family arabinose efflux permease
VLTYSGALLMESYGAAGGTVSAGLGMAAAAMVPGTFLCRRDVSRASPGVLGALTIAQGGMVAILGVVRPGAGLSLAVLTVMAFLNGWRSVIPSALGMEAAPDDKVTVMSMRAAANQFGYLLGAALGGLALAAGGFAALGVTSSALFILGAALHLEPRLAAEPSAAEMAA